VTHFDDVLERLLTDVAFKAALARDPEAALAGYRLAPDERELLRAQVSTATGADRRVEPRITKAGLFGLLSSVGGQPVDPDDVRGLVTDDLTGFVTPAHHTAVVDTVHQGLGAAPPADYHPRIDVDGDGRWDEYRVSSGTGNGLDLTADMDHDGRADFVGHDDDRDGVVDRADYDKDHDGVLDTHMADTDGDGWMDRRWRG
jgi:hypothetical protein